MSGSSSESEEESVVYTKGKKIKRTTKSMRLMPSEEEKKYRNKKFKDIDVLVEHSDKLKCTKCNIGLKSAIKEGREIYSHPLLKVLMCKDCVDFYGNGDFSLDEDHEDKYCRWCGQGGELYLCSKCICGFCPKCIKKHFGPDKRKEVENDDDWSCFFCKPNWLYELRAICALAIEASNKYKKASKAKKESKLVSMSKKTSIPAGRPRKSLRNSSPTTSASEKEPIEVDLGSSEEEAKPEKKTEKLEKAEKEKDKDKDKDKERERERERNKTPKIALKRKRGSKPLNINGKASSAADTSSDGAESEAKSSKKQKTSPKIESPKKPVASDGEAKKKKKIKKKASSDTDSSSHSEDEEPATSISAPSKQITKSMSKILDLLKITEMTAQLCLDVCRKRIKKFENKNVVVTNEKLIKESEKLNSVVTLLSTNLKTVGSNILSFQNKLGVDEKNEDDSQTDNEKTKLDLAYEELKRCKDLINEAMDEELVCRNLMEEENERDNEDGDRRKSEEIERGSGDDDREEEVEVDEAVSQAKVKKGRKDESDADDDDSEKDIKKGKSDSKKKAKKIGKSDESSDSDSGDAFISGIRRNIKIKKPAGKRKGRTKKKKSSDDDSDEDFMLYKDKKRNKRKSEKKSDDSDEELRVSTRGSRRNKQREAEGVEGGSEKKSLAEGDGSDQDSETSNKKAEIEMSETDNSDEELKKKKLEEKDDANENSEVDDEKDENTKSDVESSDEARKNKNQAEDNSDIIDKKAKKKKRSAKKSEEKLEEKLNKDSDKDLSNDNTVSDKETKKKKKSKGSDDEENIAACNPEMEVDQDQSTDIFNETVELKKTVLESSSDEERAEKEKTNEGDNAETDAVNGHSAKSDDEKTGEPDESRQEDGSGSETEEEKAKCDEKEAKDKIKLRDVKITLTRIEIPKDCDSISLNEEKQDVYDVETEDDNDDDDDKNLKTKVLDSSSDEDTKKKAGKEEKKRRRKKLLDSDEEEYKEESEDDKKSSSDEVKSIDLAGENSDSDDAFESKKKKPKVSRVSDEDASGSDDEKPNKWKRIRSKKEEKSETSSDSEQERTRKRSKKDKDSPTKGRKNIKRMIKKEKLHVETKQAVKNEEERKKRLKERQKEYEKLFPVEKDDNDKQLRLVLDYDPETKEATVEVHKKLIKKLKPHQIEGVKFMWDNCFETIKKLEEESGSGCILAHCMGLGKTLQVVTLVHTVMTHDLGVNTTLVVCPLNTVANWINEFEMWLGNVRTEPITLYDLIKYKKDYERTFQLNDWHKNGGVMVISYDMFRNLTKEKKVKKSKKKDQNIFEKTLLDPGPDLVICDEGHLLKNEDTALSKCMRRIATSRRIVLTGTPLQNNLVEYHCMVQFIKPNILGTKKEFMNRFVHPINNGQYEDSTDWDVKIMKRRSHVLHTLLDGCVQRFDYSVLTPFLPKKFEYVISITLSESQAKLYKYYLDHFSAKAEGTTRGARLFNDYHHLQRIWTHPRTLLAHEEKEEVKKLHRDDESEGSLKDFVVDDSEEELTGSGSGSESGSGSDREVTPEPQRKRLTRANANDEDIQKELEEVQKIKEKKWWDEFVSEKDYEDLRASYKLVLLFDILKDCKKLGDKVLVFSQSLYTLDLIEYFLERVDMASKKNPDESLDGHADSWQLGRDYFRLDGSTSSEKRHIWTKYFNKEKNKDARLFLISTRAGGLGINLTAANRVIIFDASWNPSHDVQSIFRVYRFGQGKTCYIYRFLAEATMEEKIYSRQVTKLSLAQRVVDEHQIERHYTMNTLTELYTYDPTPPEKRKTPIVPKDELFADMLKKHKDKIVGYHEHDSLLENKQEEVLTEEERKAAWEEFEKEKTARPAMDIAEIQQRQMLYMQQQMMQQQMQQQFNNVQLQNVQRFVNPANLPHFAGLIQNNVQRLVNPLATQVIPGVQPNSVQTTAIPTNMLQRGNLVGIRPYQGETVQSYFYRIKEEENNRIRMQQAQLLLQQLTQNQKNKPDSF